MGFISSSAAAGHNYTESLPQYFGSNPGQAAHFRRDVHRFCRAGGGDGDDTMAQALGCHKAREIDDDTQTDFNRVFDIRSLRSGPTDSVAASCAHAASLE